MGSCMSNRVPPAENERIVDPEYNNRINSDEVVRECRICVKALADALERHEDCVLYKTKLNNTDRDRMIGLLTRYGYSAIPIASNSLSVWI